MLTRREKGLWPIVALAVVLLLPSALPLAQPAAPLGQLAVPPTPGSAKPEQPTPLQDLEAKRPRVESDIQEAQGQLTEAKEAVQVSDAPPGDQGRQAQEQRAALLEARVRVGRRHFKVIDEAWAVRDQRQQLQGELDIWDWARRGWARGTC